MNRFTRELRKRDYKIDSDFEYLPYNGLVRIHFGRNMMPDEVIYEDDGNPSF